MGLSKQYLVIQTAFIGDVVLATAVIEKIHQSDPDASIDMVVRQGNEEVLKDHPFIRRLIVWNKREGKYLNLLRTITVIREYHYDGVVNLQRFAASGLMTAMARTKARFGFDKNPFSFLYTVRYPHEIGGKVTPGIHEIDRCLQLVSTFTGAGKSLPRIYPTPSDEEAILPYIGQRFVTISPASVWFTKQYPEERWIDLLKLIADHSVYLLGSASDAALCERIVSGSGHRRAVVLAGKLSLKKSAALMKHAEMNFTNDSAPMHLCSAVNAPVTAVFCSTVPEFGFGPLSTFSHIAQSSENLNCRPCGLHGHKVCPEGHFRCSRIPASELVSFIPDHSSP